MSESKADFIGVGMCFGNKAKKARHRKHEVRETEIARWHSAGEIENKKAAQ